MNSKEYIKNTAVTDHDMLGEESMIERCDDMVRVIHYVLGVGTEAGELQDAVKRALAYGKPMDKVNVKEELGDLLWYMARLCDYYDFTFEEVMETNINKLKARYGDKFTEHAALNRNLVKEREILEE